MTIQHVAYLVGYENATHFSRQFKRMSGLTPKEYRR
ncbi:helix-turn-helix domain-containing protein [Enterococcus casseliflavus]